MDFDIVRRAKAGLGKVFADREFMHYNSEQGMRVVRVSARAQMLGAGVAAALLGYTGIVTGISASAIVAPELSDELAAKDAEVRAMRAKVAALSNDVAMRSARLEKRQRFLADLYEGDAELEELAALMPRGGEAVETAALSSSLLAPFAALETKQLAFVDQAATAAEARFQGRQAFLKDLGLRPGRFTQQTLAMGGPDVAADAVGGPLADAEPRFKQLFMSWKKLDLLEKAMEAVPNFKPVKAFTYTSGFGIRFDPFKGTTAMHQGVDMAGAVGEPIYAAANGRIVKAGRHGGYGKLVEIDHGKGLTTRYAHMSRINVSVGDRVGRGEQVGAMGSTGRSTGSGSPAAAMKQSPMVLIFSTPCRPQTRSKAREKACRCSTIS